MPDAPIQLVAADLDGTLLNEQKHIAPATAQAIGQLRTLGIPFIIASARPPRSVRHIYNELNLDSPQINYNGALIWDEPRRQVVFHAPLSGPLTLQMILFARQLQPSILVTCEILDRWHTDRLDNTFTTETGRLFQPDVIAPVETFCNQDITKLLLLGPSDVVTSLEHQIAQRYGPQITMVRTDQELIQITAANVSKAAALVKVADYYHVPLAHVLAIGDADNDLEMLRECGFGVAVANASPRLKAQANWIAPSPNSHGVLDALQKYVLPA
jgi:Cof subfamily protein (haloacid dehalogenase superfamily)